jgi:hypothetical protein
MGVIIPVSRPERELPMLTKWVQHAIDLNLEMVFVLELSLSWPLEKYLDFFSSYPASTIKLISGNFGSPGSSRNEGLKHLISDWVAFWDGDDEPNVIGFYDMVKAADLNGFSITMGSFKSESLTSGISVPHLLEGHNQGTRNTFIRNPGLWRFAFKRSHLKEEFFQNLSMGEDIVFLVLNISDFQEVFSWEGNVYTYFVNDPGSLTSNSKNFKDGLRAADFLSKRIKGAKDPELLYIISIRLCLGVIKHGSSISKTAGLKKILGIISDSPGMFWGNRRAILRRTV